MDKLTSLVIGIIQIALLNLALSGDNIGIIALATRNLPEKHARKASMFGITAAIVFRIVFACFITYIIGIQWLHVKLIGGLLLVKITWDFIKPQGEEENANVKIASKFWEAVSVITIADITMSLDNALATAAAADGKMGLIVFGTLLNIPVLFFGSQLIANLMKKYVIVIYCAGAILAHTSLKMILEDKLIISYIPHITALLVPWIAGLLVITYGFFAIKNLPALAKEDSYKKLG